VLVLVDIDGVVSDPRKLVGKYLVGEKKDWKGYLENNIHQPAIEQMVELIESMHIAGHEIRFHTGRPEINRENTELYLKSLFPWIEIDGNLEMRKTGDNRAGAEIKLCNCKMLNPGMVIDDEPYTIKLLKENGYMVLQVHGFRLGDDSDGIP
jgi:hypothetical protein